MADVKISALPAATELANADEFPANESGVTSRIRKDIFLTGAASEDISLTASAGNNALLSGNAGNAGVTITNDDSIQITAVSHVQTFVAGLVDDNIILVDGNTGIFIEMDQNLKFRVTASGNNHILDYDDSTHIFKIGYPYAVDIRYLAGTSGDWLTSAPTDVWTAIDRLARCFTTNSLIKP